MDLASIGLVVDSSQVKEATRSLDAMASSGGNAEKSVQQFKTSMLAAGAAMGGTLLAIKASISAANEYQKALNGLASVAKYAGQDVQQTLNKATSLTTDGLLATTEAATALKNLLARGFSTDQAVTMIDRFKDSAAFGRQSSLEFGQAVVSATEGIKNENSVLVDNAGVTKNVAAMWKEYAAQIGKTADTLTLAEKRQAEYTGILRETEAQIGNAALAAQGYEGAIARMNKANNDAAIIMGQAFTPVVTDLATAITWLAENAMKPAIFFVKSMGVSFAEAAMKIALVSEFMSSPSNWIADGVKRFEAQYEQLGIIAEQSLIDIVNSLNLEAKAQESASTATRGAAEAESAAAVARAARNKEIEKEIDLENKRMEKFTDYLTSIEDETRAYGQQWETLVWLNAEKEILKAKDDSEIKSIMEVTQAYIDNRKVVDAATETEKQLADEKEKSAKSALEATKDAAKASADFQKQVSHNIGDVLYQSLSGSFVNIADMFKKMLLRMIADAAANRIMVSMGATMFGTAANAAGGVATQGILGAGGLAGAGGTLTAGMSAGWSGGFAAVGSASGAMATTGAALGAAAAVVAPIAAAYVIGKYGFGIGNERYNVGAQRMVGTVGTGGVDARMAQDWKKDGGWFTSGSSGTDYSAMSQAMINRIKYDAASVQQIFVDYGKAIGDTSIATKYFNADVNDLANGIGNQLVPELQKFRMEGESMVDTAKRMTQAIAQSNAFIKTLQDTAIGQFQAAIGAKEALKATALGLRDFIQSIGIKTLLGAALSFSAINAQAALTGDASQVQGAASGYLSSAQKTSGSATEYARSVAFVQGELGKTALALEGKATTAELQLTELQGANKYLAGIDINTGNTKNAVTDLEKTLITLNKSIAVTQNTEALKAKVGETFNASLAMPDATGAVSYINPQVDQYTKYTASGGDISSVVNEALKAKHAAVAKATDDIAGFNSLMNQATAMQSQGMLEQFYGILGGYAKKLGVTEATAGDIVSGIRVKLDGQLVAANAMPEFALGSNYIPYDQVAMVHQGEEITPKPFVDMQRGERQRTNELLAELRAEIQTMRQNSQAEQRAIATNTEKTARLLDKFDGQGMPEVRIE